MSCDPEHLVSGLGPGNKLRRPDPFKRGLNCGDAAELLLPCNTVAKVQVFEHRYLLISRGGQSDGEGVEVIGRLDCQDSIHTCVRGCPPGRVLILNRIMPSLDLAEIDRETYL